MLKLQYFLFIIIIPCISFSAHAQSDLSKMPHTLLWEIKGKDAKPSYIYGTMHTENDQAFHLMDSVLIDFKRCSGFAMEVDEDSMQPGQAMAEMLMPEGKTISGMLSPEEYDSLNANFSKATGMPLLLYDKVRPIYLWVMLSEGKDVAKETGVFLDIFFFELAKKQAKNVYGLEKPEDQLKLLRDIPIEAQLGLLVTGARDYKVNQKELKQDYSAYENADYAVLMKDEENDTLLSKDFNTKFITTRNHNMADKADELIKKGPLFIAVGAAHLPGDEGVLNLLRQKGYSVRPVISKKRMEAKQVKKMVKE